MKGYQVTFLTVENHKHKGKPVAHWLVDLAKEMGLRGATVVPATEGFGAHGRLHSAHFFELADRPSEVVIVVSDAECDALFERLAAEGVRIFYLKSPVEFGMLGGESG
ncbi:MAG TPA: DUF190 domain-containing protein [Usitatibacter sp.]|nr:DUF190 domain-containing protein [Usitatibacter sp.]